MTQRQLQAVLFDMGDILYDATQWRRWLASRLRDLAIDIDYPKLVRMWEASLLPVYLGTEDYWVAFDGLLRSLGLPKAIRNGIQTEAEVQGRKLAANHIPIPGVAEGLKALHQGGLRLGVLSDTEAGEPKIREKLAKFGIDHFFQVVCSSREIGAVKPMPRAFHDATSALRSQPQCTAFVGHDSDELQGALDMGMVTIAFNYEGAAPATATASTFAEVVQLLLRLDPRQT